MTIQIQHTPGPWAFGDDGVLQGANGDAIGKIYGLEDFPCLDELDQEEWTKAENECEANCSLIMAAPDLLEALEYCVKQCAASGHLDTEPHMLRANEAIAKARAVPTADYTPPTSMAQAAYDIVRNAPS